MKPSYRTLVWRGDSVKKKKNKHKRKRHRVVQESGAKRVIWWDQIKNKRERMLFLTNGSILNMQRIQPGNKG